MLGRLLVGRGEERSISSQQLAALFAPSYQFGYTPVAVSTASTLGHSASAACVDVLASSVSTMPLDAVRHVGKIRRPVNPTPPLLAAPSVLVDLDVWLYQVVESMCTDGNAFGLVVAVDQTQRPTQIELLDAASVTDRRVADGVPEARIDGGKAQRLYPHGDLWHVPGRLVRAGSPFADSPIERASATIGAAIAARDFGARFFGDGGHPSSIIYSDRELELAQAQAIKQAYIAATRGNREPAVFGAGLKHEQVSVNPNETQFLDLMRFTTEEACRFWRVPPSMVYAATSGQSVTYANVSQADLHYLKHSLDGYLVRLERALSRLLARPQVVRFNRNALLRTDAETRHKVYDRRLRNKTMTVDEVRALEDEEPFGDDSDKPGIPGGDTTSPSEEAPNGPTD